MGVIQIRQRSESLGNLPGVMRADVRTGGAEALAAQARQTGAEGAAKAGLVGDALKGAGALLGIAAKIAERNEHEEATAAANAYMAEKRAFYEGASDGAGSFVPGYLSKGVENPGSYVTGAAEADAEMKERHFGKLGRRQRELAERAVQGFDIQTQRAVTHRAQEAWTARRVKAADEFMGQTALNAVRLGPDADANLAASTWGAWEDSVEEAMDVRGIHGEAERAEFRRKAAQGVVNAAFARRVAEIRESCAGLEDEGEASKAWDDLEDGIGELGWEAIAGGGVKDAEGREIDNPLRRMLAGTDEEKLKADALETVRRERERSKREARNASQSSEIMRDREERKTIGEISNISANALAQGGIDNLEGALEEMNARAAKMPKGSRLETVALREAKRLDAAAQAKADQLTWDAIIDHARDGSKWEPTKGSRMAKNYKRLKESYDRQAAAYAAEGMLAEASAVQEERKANYASLRVAMLDAAAVDPGGFSARLAEAAEKGHVTLDQYRRLSDEFRDVWTKEGMPQKGAALVQILKNEFYAGKDYDLNDRLAVNPKSGRFEYARDPETKKPFEGEDVEFKAQVLVPYDPHDWFGLKDFLGINRATHYETTTRTFTSDEQLKMLDWAMELAQHDGEWISTDPQTGAKLDKPRKLDAAAELQDACSRLRTSKRAEASQDLVMERANAMLSLRAGFAQSDDAVTGAAAKREAAELKTRETLKSAKRRPFAPKMPGGPRGESAASEGEED